VAEGGGLLNRYRVVKPYRGFESLRLRYSMFSGTSRIFRPEERCRSGRDRRGLQRFPPAQKSAQCVFGPFWLWPDRRAKNKTSTQKPRGASRTTSNAPDRQIGGAGTWAINHPSKSISVAGIDMPSPSASRKAFVVDRLSTTITRDENARHFPAQH
jgi:hypothetical protein